MLKKASHRGRKSIHSSGCLGCSLRRLSSTRCISAGNGSPAPSGRLVCLLLRTSSKGLLLSPSLFLSKAGLLGDFYCGRLICFTPATRRVARLPFTARIQRAHADRARCASKKGSLARPPSLTLLRPRAAGARESTGHPVLSLDSPECRC